MKKLIIITIALSVILGIVYLVNASNDQDTFMKNWNQAGLKKLEEQTKKAQAEKLLKEAEQARIEKEKLLGIYNTGNADTMGKLQP